jgi:hypothetical protein
VGSRGPAPPAAGYRRSCSPTTRRWSRLTRPTARVAGPRASRTARSPAASPATSSPLSRPAFPRLMQRFVPFLSIQGLRGAQRSEAP